MDLTEYQKRRRKRGVIVLVLAMFFLAIAPAWPPQMAFQCQRFSYRGQLPGHARNRLIQAYDGLAMAQMLRDSRRFHFLLPGPAR